MLLKQYWSKSVLISEVNPNELVKYNSEDICLFIKFV